MSFHSCLTEAGGPSGPPSLLARRCGGKDLFFPVFSVFELIQCLNINHFTNIIQLAQVCLSIKQ